MVAADREEARKELDPISQRLIGSAPCISHWGLRSTHAIPKEVAE